MTISLTEDFKTVAELVNDPDGLLDQLKKTGRPINITRDGKPTAVILDVETFERLIQAINLAKFIGPAEEDVLAGRTKPLKEFIEEFESAKKISRTHHRPGTTGRASNS
jgi:prevent-host-death family protein